jgi:hypothetical protein
MVTCHMRSHHRGPCVIAPRCSQGLQDQIVTACAGMPLALELAGSQLKHQRDTEVWQVRGSAR